MDTFDELTDDQITNPEREHWACENLARHVAIGVSVMFMASTAMPKSAWRHCDPDGLGRLLCDECIWSAEESARETFESDRRIAAMALEMLKNDTPRTKRRRNRATSQTCAPEATAKAANKRG